MRHPALNKTDHRPWPLPDGPWKWRQSWCDLLFAHWPLPARRLRPHVPEPLRIQEYGGISWVGVVPFRMEGVMHRPLPDLPWISSFPELNLRLYVEYGNKPGVWFLSLDADNALAVWAARRFFHLPYHDAEINVERRGHRLVYRSHRKHGDTPIDFAADYRPVTHPLCTTPGSLEHWLTERYCLYAQTGDGVLYRAEVHHRPWPLQQARAEIYTNELLTPFDIRLPDRSPLLHFARRLDVVVWPPQRIPIE